MSTWLITGCSTGLGRALAEAVIAAGHNAVVTARDVAKVTDLAVANTDRVLALPLDVTDAAQVIDAVSQAEEKFGGIDVLVNNAGYGYRAAVEEGDDSDIRELFETQFFGAVAMIKAVLPGMRARRSGAIINISTIGVALMPCKGGSAVDDYVPVLGAVKIVRPVGRCILTAPPLRRDHQHFHDRCPDHARGLRLLRGIQGRA
jgi:NAD(P)-dependent dehydrogenase (short-subunit alcohol dehydrogenase family)